MSVDDIGIATSTGTTIVRSNEKNSIIVSTLALSVIVEAASVKLRIDSFSASNHIDVGALSSFSCVIFSVGFAIVSGPGSTHYSICVINVLPGASKGGALIVHPLSHDATV